MSWWSFSLEWLIGTLISMTRLVVCFISCIIVASTDQVSRWTGGHHNKVIYKRCQSSIVVDVAVVSQSHLAVQTPIQSGLFLRDLPRWHHQVHHSNIYAALTCLLQI
jgi:hypothetical protein